MFYSFLVFLACILSVQGVLNEFIYPFDDGVNVTRDTPVTLRWSCNAGDTPITLIAWQNKHNEGTFFPQALLADTSNPGHFTWTPNTIAGLPFTDGFHFQIKYSNVAFDSGALFIVPASQISSTLSTSTFTSTPTETQGTTKTPTQQTTSSATTSSSTATITSSSDSSSSPKSNRPLKVDLGVGLGIGIPFLLLVGGLAGWIISRRANTTASRHELASKHIICEAPPQQQVMEMTGDGRRQELHEDQTPSELPTEDAKV